MPAGRTNKFAKARQHLRSTHLDEKIQMLSEIPTNNTTTFFVVEPDVFETIPAVRAPLDLTADDASLVGKDTSGLFDNAGNSLAESPPGDTSYILGPMVSVYFPDGDYTAIGYIQKDTRKVINLARIPGPMSGWGVGGNVEGFTSYSQLTLEQALWYRDKLLNGNTSSYRVFYIGVFEQLNSETDVTDPSTGVDIDEFGRWLGEIISDGFISEPERQELIKKGIKGSDPNMPPGIANPVVQKLKDKLKRGENLTIDDFPSAADYSAFKNGGGNAALRQGKTIDEVIRQGIQNINQYNQDPRVSQGMADALDVKNSNSLGDKIMRFFGDLGDLAQGKVINSTDYNAQLAINLTKSIITGSPQEITLGDGAKRDQINSVDPNALGNVLQIGTAPTPNASNAVNPTPGMKSDQVLQGGWGAQGGSEFSYDPVTDTFTITSNKMLRTGQDGDQFDITKGGRVSNGQVVDRGKQTAFGDIPDVDPKVVDQKVKQILDSPVISGYLNALGATVGGVQGTGNLYQKLKNNPDAYEKFEDDVAQVGRDIARGGVQGSASNTVAIRKALTDLGFPKSETENMGAGYGQVFSQTEYKGSEIPKEIRDVINTKTSKNESFRHTRKRILREIKNDVVLPDEKKEKLKGYRPKVNKTGIKSVGDGLMKKAEVPTSFKRLEDTMWKKQDRDWNARYSQERKNMILDAVGTSDHAWEYITDRSASDNDAKMYEHFGQGVKNKIIEKKKIGNDYIIKMYNEEGKVETVTQSVLNERLQKQHELVEQETIRAPKDPLIARIRNKLYSQIDYPDKPAKLGYPNEPPKQMVGGYHPEFGDRHAYYNRLDRHSADTMQNAPTQDPKIDKKVNSQITQKRILKRVRELLRKNK